eukprot:jgi/Mesvir1/6023/Mv00768-RA.1
MSKAVDVRAPLLPERGVTSSNGVDSPKPIADTLADVEGKGDFWRVLQEAREERLALVVASLFLLVGTLANLELPRYAGIVLDAVAYVRESGPERAMATVRHAMLMVAAFIVIGSLASIIRAYLFAAAGERVVARLRRKLFNHLMRQEVGFYDTVRVGELMNRLVEDTSIMKSAATGDLAMALRGLATGAFGLVYMFMTSWQLSVVTLVTVPPVVIGIRCYGQFVKKLSKETQAAAAASSAIALQAMSLVRTVATFAQEEAEGQRYDAQVNASLALGLKQAVAAASMVGVSFAIAASTLMAVLYLGALLAIRGEISTGSLSTFVLYTLTVGTALGSISSYVAVVYRALGASTRVFALLDRVPLLAREGTSTPCRDPAAAEASLEGVWFAYPSQPDKWVLRGVDLTLGARTTTALVGHSGSGKSTVTNLLQRFYDPQRGVVRLDGVPLADIHPGYLHRQVTLVSQEPVLFAGTIAANISYGVGQASHEQIEYCARMANAHDFIQGFPDGYATQVGERGVRLSGGQKQRITIARALMMKPRLLLLDEATSALDAQSEALVHDALDRITKEPTVLVIAHRLSTVMSAHAVLVMEDGELAERGTHASLLANPNSIYANLVHRQLSRSGSSIGGWMGPLAFPGWWE